jgi:hypothetical protein
MNACTIANAFIDATVGTDLAYVDRISQLTTKETSFTFLVVFVDERLPLGSQTIADQRGELGQVKCCFHVGELDYAKTLHAPRAWRIEHTDSRSSS